MERWTFLLQKDGDRSWLPLDSPDVEILAGRYRIVAQTSHPHTDISLRICHLSSDGDSPRRRIQKRSHRTNANGLMVVIPFTCLDAGFWELSCFLSDPMSDLVGETVHRAVRLRVRDRSLAVEADLPQFEAEPTAPPAEICVEPAAQVRVVQPELIQQAAATVIPAPTTTGDLAALNVEIAQALGLSMDRLVEMTDQLSHQLVADIFREFNLVLPIADPTIAETAAQAQSEAVQAEEIQAETVQAEELQPAIDPTTLRIVLQQDGWTARRGENLTIAGRFEAGMDEPDSEPADSELAGAIAQEIQIQLRDPQTSKVLFHACQPFPAGAMPAPFSFLCCLPQELSTYLLLGEVLISGTLPGAEGVMVTLKTHNFTLTIDPEILVEELQKVKTVLAESVDLEEVPELLAQLSNRMRQKAVPSLDLSFLEMTALAPEPLVEAEAVSTKISTSTRQILPPQLHQPEPALSDRKLQLPVFVGQRAGVERDAAIAPPVEPAIEASFQMDDLNLESMGLPELLRDEIPHTEPDNLETVSAVESPEFSSPEPDLGAAELTAFDELSSPIRTAFQALNLQDRFLNRLNSLAADAELMTLLKLMQPPETATEPETATIEQTAIAPDVTGSFTDDEVVVDDDPSWREWVKRAGSRSKRAHPDPIQPPPNPLVLAEDAAVPVPTLEIITDELVAGKLINVRVKLPHLLPKIYVKLWVNDRQTRSLLDGPRWLVDFLPDGHGELEALTQLTAPFGSLDIRLEAIAVEMHTQRESQKASLEREVLSPDLPDELVDFDL